MANANYLRQQALKCRRLAQAVDQKDVAKTLLEMADQYEEEARRLDSAERQP